MRPRPAHRSRAGAARAALLVVLAALAPAADGLATTYFVRQTVGKDANDGRTPATAWEHVAPLSAVLRAGDTAYVGPGLYREQITPVADGAPGAPITLVADPGGRHTGDPPGPVVLAGADPVDETVFAPAGPPGVYTAPFPFEVWGVVEMDGPQERYTRATNTAAYLSAHQAPADIVAGRPGSYHYDRATRVLTLRTSDGRPPTAHDLELLRRAAGVYLLGRHHVTVVGFTFRHMQDAGISFFKGSSHGLALDNVAYGSRQGIRVYGATAITLAGNTLFRNENSGAYFAAGARAGVAIDNVAWENVKGLRWSSASSGAVAAGNVLFDNHERGLALENVTGAVLRGNVLANNAVSQLLVLQSAYHEAGDCYATGRPEQLVADFTPFPLGDRFPTLAAYQAARRQNLDGRAGDCGPLPGRVDVHALHAASMAYAERARALLAGPAPSRGWLDRLLGR